MKMSAFVMGGIVGAALTVAIRRSPKWSVAAGMLGRELKNRSFGMKEGALGKMFDMRFNANHSERRDDSDREGFMQPASKKIRLRQSRGARRHRREGSGRPRRRQRDSCGERTASHLIGQRRRG
ncbi:hypothetical protein [Cohnella rhizosphaerae]|uniref:Uncharacterized protein n=1 Tax=Cohnella rhizosphaerae TaxID=1457232 RepID=A0A9X4KXS6_9BACL|nr:hypothetical protein [Cohnella rhizosphaerae]MDG0813135.1 hypothetical protein [Cohnella rhizosphaerae]